MKEPPVILGRDEMEELEAGNVFNMSSEKMAQVVWILGGWSGDGTTLHWSK